MNIQNSMSVGTLPPVSVSGTSSMPVPGAGNVPDKSSGSSGTSHSAQLQQAVSTLNQSASFLNRDLTFSVDKATHDTVVKVVEAQTGQVITQIPSKQALAIAQAISAMPQKSGVLLNRKA
ncbi:MAG: flagellar protein FlaG [Betaproteobacteria bacterium]|jgi:Uncharacterized flagellar protein FlaG|nr:flagellar protein FlaG [Betaproteobacteria bacterium]